MNYEHLMQADPELYASMGRSLGASATIWS